MACRKAIRKIRRLLHLKERSAPTAAPAPSAPEAPAALSFETLFSLARSRESVCVFAPMFTKENEKDGYVQRVRAIDGTILNGLMKFYAMNDPSCGSPLIRQFDEDHIYIVFNSYDAEQRALIFELAKLCGRCYTHSILRFMTDCVAAEMCDVFLLPNIHQVWDVHGSVPEEYKLDGSDLGCQLANDVEAILYARADTIVCVNHAMARHLQIKHGTTGARFVILPIFSPGTLVGVDCAEDKALKEGELPRIVYAGGTQAWQNMELMQDIMEKTMDRCEYRIFVPKPPVFHELWGDRAALKNALVSSRTPEEMGREYRGCHYGFVLRDDIVVNNVACPTKIIEYIQYGIVPVLKTAKIGDFQQLGLQYITADDLLAGNLPNNEERDRIAASNLLVLEKLKSQHETGLSELMERIKNER